MYVGTRTMLASWAAERGKVDCLRVFHEHGITLDGSVSYAAARVGSLACLQYAHELGDRWNPNTILEAASKGTIYCYCTELLLM
jgi:hypothetical protein